MRAIAGPVISLAILATLGGCAAREVRTLYPGPPQPRDKIAVIIVQGNLLGIDNVSYSEPRSGFDALPNAEVLPGVHRIRYRAPPGVTYLSLSPAGEVPVAQIDLWFEAEAGHRYYLCAALTESRRYAPVMCRVQGTEPSLATATTSTPIKTWYRDPKGGR